MSCVRDAILRFSPHIPPRVQRNKLTGNGHARCDKILDRTDDIGNTHVFRRVVVLIDSQDARVLRVMGMQFLKISWIFRDQYQALTSCITKVNLIELSSKACVEWGDDCPANLTKQSHQGFIIRTVVKINPEAQGRSLFLGDSVCLLRPRRQSVHGGFDNRQGPPGLLQREGRTVRLPAQGGAGRPAC